MISTPKTVIVKVTDACGLGCTYCYAGETGPQAVCNLAKRDSHKMSTSVLERMTEQFATQSKNKRTHFIWHGGEPLEMGLDFYNQVAHLQYWVTKQTGHVFENSMQTNGTLVTDDVIDFARKHKFSLGFSLDGPSAVHGKTRPYLDGRNSYDAVFCAITRAKAANLGGGAIVVVNKVNLPYLDEIYDFFKREKLGLKLNPLIPAGRAIYNKEQLGITPDEYATAMIRLFDRYIVDSDMTSVDPFDTFLGNVASTQNAGCCTFSTNCQKSFLSIAYDGDVFPCGRFDRLEPFKYGNIMTQTLDEVLASEIRHKLLTRSADNDAVCSPCEYKKLCYSGCMSNGMARKGNPFDRDFYCASYRRLFTHIGKFVDTELAKAKVA